MSTPDKLLDANKTADGTTSPIVWDGGDGTFAVYGTFDGGTGKLQASFDDGATWLDVGGAVSFTGNNVGNFALPTDTLLRGRVIGSNGSPDLQLEIMELYTVMQGYNVR